MSRYTDPYQERGVKPRTCGHAFVLTFTCKECARWLEDARQVSNQQVGPPPAPPRRVPD